jgi:hypothetical protein
VGDIYHDLVTLAEEFDTLDYKRNAHWLSVTTEPIELQGIYLGPFEIRLGWNRVADANGAAYRVVASEPHPAASRETVTHPHVMDENLCEGEGRTAIRGALAQGRLLDFFTLVAGVLRTYSAESPFVPLSAWYGEACSDCGGTIDDDEGYTCQRCDELVCEDCQTTCAGCQDSLCSDCVHGCSICEDNYCRGCLQTCAQCDAHCCTNCLDEDERCTHCHDEEPEDGNDSGHPALAGATVQPLELGQAVIPA